MMDAVDISNILLDPNKIIAIDPEDFSITVRQSDFVSSTNNSSTGPEYTITQFGCLPSPADPEFTSEHLIKTDYVVLD